MRVLHSRPGTKQYHWQVLLFSLLELISLRIMWASGVSHPACWARAPSPRSEAGASLDGTRHGPGSGGRPPSGSQAQSQMDRGDQCACCAEECAIWCCASTKPRAVWNAGLPCLQDPLFLASSVFVKKIERVMATGFMIVLCLLVYRLAEYRIRQRLEETNTIVLDQLKKPTKRPTLRWLFQWFEGISLVLMQREEPMDAVQVTRLTDLHLFILGLLGPSYTK